MLLHLAIGGLAILSLILVRTPPQAGEQISRGEEAAVYQFKKKAVGPGHADSSIADDGSAEGRSSG